MDVLGGVAVDVRSPAVKSKLELGKRIHESFQSHSYVDDEIVIELLKQAVTELEKKGSDYIIEGFPKTQR